MIMKLVDGRDIAVEDLPPVFRIRAWQGVPPNGPNEAIYELTGCSVVEAYEVLDREEFDGADRLELSVVFEGGESKSTVLLAVRQPSSHYGDNRTPGSTLDDEAIPSYLFVQ